MAPAVGGAIDIIVIVEDHDEARIQRTGIVQRLIGIPAESAPSPITAMTLRGLPESSAATAMPRPA